MIKNPGPWLIGQRVRYIGDGYGSDYGAKIGVVKDFDVEDESLDVRVEFDNSDYGLWLSTGNGNRKQYLAYGVELAEPTDPLWSNQHIYVQATDDGHMLHVSNDIPLKGDLLDELITVLQYVQMKEKEQ